MKILLFIILYTSTSFGQNLDTIKKIEIFYGYGAQCFPNDGIYARSEKFIFEKLEDGDFELTNYYKFWDVSKKNASLFTKDSIVKNLNKKCDSNILLNFLKNLNEDKQNFSSTFLYSKIEKPSSRRIIRIAKKINKYYILECDGLFDCKYRNQLIDSIRRFERFDEFLSSMNLTKNQIISIGYYHIARITIISENNNTVYDFSFKNNSIGQPIIKNYNENYMVKYALVNLIANEKIRDLIPTNTMTYKAFDLKNITNDYISWYLDN